MLGARADASEDKCCRQHGDVGACAEQQIGRPRGSGADRKDFCSTDPMGHAGDRDLQPRHHGGIKRAKYADCRVAQGELRLPQWQQHIERIGKAIMQRVGAAGDP